ncbi:MAG: hypothetical protein IKA64_05880 [Clostridia bacterium]|nr:hypothetical protein [Clostridia bacterium]
MKKITSVLLIILMLASSLLLFACKKEPEAEDVTRMTIDINPSIELILDKDDKVVSVTALNDDGAILLAGEVIVGKSAEEAAELIIKLAGETGYLVKGENAENEIKISFSQNKKALEAAVKSKIESELDELDIKGIITEIEAMRLEELRALVLANSLYTEEQVNAMSESELYRALSLARVESALLATEDLREAYFKAKAHEIAFAEREETAKIIDGMGTLYEISNAAYKALLTAYGELLAEIDEYRYEGLISPDSQYQKGLSAMRDVKAELVAKKNELASLATDSEEYNAKLEAVAALEESYTAALESYEAIGKAINDGIDALLSELKSIEAELIKLEGAFSEDIRSELTEKAAELESAINEAKDGFFAAFESEHADTLTAIENELLARKEALIEANAN